jgi:hypothetical protein
MNKVMAACTRIFENYDEAMLVFISKCLSEGKEVAINAAGPQNLMITAAHGLFRKPGEQLDQDRVHAIMDGLEKLRKRYHDDEGRELLTGGLDSWIYPEKFMGIAQKYGFVKHKTFKTRDDDLITEVEGFLKRNKMVIVAAWEETADVYLEPDHSSRGEKPIGEASIPPRHEVNNPVGATLFCTSCGAPMPPQHRFCTKCGARARGGARGRSALGGG